MENPELIKQWNNNMNIILLNTKALTIDDLSNDLHLLFHLPPYNGYPVVFTHPFSRLYTRLLISFEFFYSMQSDNLRLHPNENSISFIIY